MMNDIPDTQLVRIVHRRWLGEPLSEAEQAYLDRWLHGSAYGQQLLDEVADDEWLQQQLSAFHTIKKETDNRWERLLPTLETAAAPRISFLRRWGWAAASILILVSVGAYLYNSVLEPGKQVAHSTSPAVAEIFPGTDRALLTLSDGTVIPLDSAANGAIARQGNAAIVKLDNGEIRYNLKGAADGVVMMNTMSTPKGGQYRLTLPDGTRVWLNALSSIRFPAVFTGNDRKVAVTGEAYFEVRADKSKPFIVNINDLSSIEVLGTSFNINSYKDEGVIRTTLVDGSIKVNRSNILRPGEQAVQAAGVQVVKVLKNIDTEGVVAWKNGLFNLDGLTLDQLLRQLARWYDVTIVYERKVPAIPLEGEVSRSANLSEAVGILQGMGVRCRIEERKLIIE